MSSDAKLKVHIPGRGQVTPGPKVAALVEKLCKHASDLEALDVFEVTLSFPKRALLLTKSYPPEPKQPV